MYHTKRMQHVICVRWSADNKYILSGSDEMNIRLWKADASEKLGVVSVFRPTSVTHTRALDAHAKLPNLASPHVFFF